MGRRTAAIALSALCLIAPVACGGDDEAEPEEPPSTTAPVDEGLHVRTEDRMIAGLRSLVVRPSADGPFPLVVFVHGAGAPPEFYGGLLEDVAAVGYIVVAPAMPGTVDHSDFSALAALPFQPGRVRDVIDAVTEGPQVIHAADPGRVVVMGHSLGGMTALATAFNTCCRDSRVDAVVSMAGELAPFPGGIYGLGSVPALLIHGQADDTVPIRGSHEALQVVGTSAYLLTVSRGGHGEYLGEDDAAYPAVLAAVLAFLDATVGGDPAGGLSDLRTAGRQPGVHLTSRG